MVVKEITTQEELNEACKSAKKAVAIDFHAQWCGPCKIIGPKFVIMSDDPKFQNLVFVKVDVDEAEDLAESFGISAMPTFIIVDKDGKKIDEIVGANDGKLKTTLEKHFHNMVGRPTRGATCL